MPKATTQTISLKNVERIKNEGAMGESFDHVLSRILDDWEECRKRHPEQ